MTGRPSAITPEVQKKLCMLLRSGVPRNTACLVAGIGRRTFYDHLKTDRTFRTAIKKAEARPERRWLSLIEKAARDPKHWTAAAWLLERRWPEKYSLRLTRMLEKEREAMLAELRATVDQKTFTEVARALLAAQRNARGGGRERHVQH
jgi:hypothetical protein